MSQGVSIKDLTAEWRRNPRVLAYSEPDVSSIAPHVFEAHEEAKRNIKRHGSATAEITFNPDAGAFELVAETRDAMDALRALGAGAKITIHY